MLEIEQVKGMVRNVWSLLPFTTKGQRAVKTLFLEALLKA